jgi:hypothetical protein
MKKKKKTTTKKAALRFCNTFDLQIFGADFDSVKVRAGALVRVLLPPPPPPTLFFCFSSAVLFCRMR